MKIEQHQRYTATLRLRRGDDWNVRPGIEPYDGTTVTVEAGWPFVGEDAEQRPEYAGEWAMLYVGDSREIPGGWVASGDLEQMQALTGLR